MPQDFFTSPERLYLPFLSRFYNGLAQHVGWLAFRIVIGGKLTIEGWAKIQHPMGLAGFAQSLGFALG